MDIVWKGILGGLAAALIVLASRRANVLPGILPLAPDFAIVALLAVGAKGFKLAVLASAKTIPAYLVFLGARHLLIDRFDYRLAISGGAAARLVAAFAIFLAPRLF